MTISTREFVASAIKIDAVQVTNENIHDLAAWCHGDVKDYSNTLLDFPDQRLYIQFIATDRQFRSRQALAFVDDWIFTHQKKFDTLQDKAFKEEFQPAVVSDKRQQVLELVAQSMTEARGGFGMSKGQNEHLNRTAQEITDMIMGVFR